MDATPTTPAAQTWPRPMGVDAAELHVVCTEIYQTALAQPPFPRSNEPRDVLVWKAAKWVRAINNLDRALAAAPEAR